MFTFPYNSNMICLLVLRSSSVPSLQPSPCGSAGMAGLRGKRKRDQWRRATCLSQWRCLTASMMAARYGFEAEAGLLYVDDFLWEVRAARQSVYRRWSTWIVSAPCALSSWTSSVVFEIFFTLSRRLRLRHSWRAILCESAI